jgi:hypothetical protein
VKDAHLISVDELRASGALDVPASWRNSLFVERDLFSDLVDDEETHPNGQDLSPGGDDEDEAIDDSLLTFR